MENNKYKLYFKVVFERIRLIRLKEKLIWLFYDFTGIRFIWYKIVPQTEEEKNKERPPAAFLLWFIGIYAALFGIAFQRYESRVNVIENRASIIYNQIFSSYDEVQYKKNLGLIPTAQSMTCPPEPNILNPFSVISSLFNDQEKHKEVVELFQGVIENSSGRLSGVDFVCQGLKEDTGYVWVYPGGGGGYSGNIGEERKNHYQGIDLRDMRLYKEDFSGSGLNCGFLDGAILPEANFQDASLAYSSFFKAKCPLCNFQNSKLIKANFQSALLLNTDFTGADLSSSFFNNSWLIRVNFTGANLENADFGGADLRHAVFDGANCVGANFAGAMNLNAEELLKAKALYGAKFDSEIEKKLKEYPDLFAAPKEKEVLNASSTEFDLILKKLSEQLFFGTREEWNAFFPEESPE
jgi:uncharacterized protein YjbI with pentapeptide repeats